MRWKTSSLYFGPSSLDPSGCLFPLGLCNIWNNFLRKSFDVCIQLRGVHEIKLASKWEQNIVSKYLLSIMWIYHLTNYCDRCCPSIDQKGRYDLIAFCSSLQKKWWSSRLVTAIIVFHCSDERRKAKKCFTKNVLPENCTELYGWFVKAPVMQSH